MAVSAPRRKTSSSPSAIIRDGHSVAYTVHGKSTPEPRQLDLVGGRRRHPATAAFQVIIVELLGTFASTEHLSGRLWLTSVLIGSASLVIGAILKLIPVDSSSDASDRRDGYQPIPTGHNAV